MPLVAADPVAHVRDMWAAYARGGAAAMRPYMAPDVELVPLSEGRAIAPDDLWGEWGRAHRERISAVVHGVEAHGSCVLAHGSLRTFREGGFVDVQPSWVYFFEDGRIVRAQGFATREAALVAIRERGG